MNLNKKEKMILHRAMVFMVYKMPEKIPQNEEKDYTELLEKLEKD